MRGGRQASSRRLCTRGCAWDGRRRARALMVHHAGRWLRRSFVVGHATPNHWKFNYADLIFVMTKRRPPNANAISLRLLVDHLGPYTLSPQAYSEPRLSAMRATLWSLLLLIIGHAFTTPLPAAFHARGGWSRWGFEGPRGSIGGGNASPGRPPCSGAGASRCSPPSRLAVRGVAAGPFKKKPGATSSTPPAGSCGCRSLSVTNYGEAGHLQRLGSRFSRVLCQQPLGSSVTMVANTAISVWPGAPPYRAARSGSAGAARRVYDGSRHADVPAVADDSRRLLSQWETARASSTHYQAA